MTETVAMVDPVKVGLYIKSVVEERGGRVAAVYSGVGHVTPPSDIDPEWEIYHHDLDRTVRFLAKHTPAELRHALACELGRRNIAGTVQDSVVIQEYLAGPQFSANTVSMGGRHWLTEIYEQEIDESGTPPLTRHLLLRTRLGHLEWSVTEFVFACLDALGIREGAAHTEVCIVNGEPALIEMNPRLMGPVMEPDPNFIALGYTQQHVLVDRFLRPAEFKRQLDIPY